MERTLNEKQKLRALVFSSLDAGTENGDGYDMMNEDVDIIAVDSMDLDYGIETYLNEHVPGDHPALLPEVRQYVLEWRVQPSRGTPTKSSYEVLLAVVDALSEEYLSGTMKFQGQHDYDVAYALFRGAYYRILEFHGWTEDELDSEIDHRVALSVKKP